MNFWISMFFLGFLVLAGAAGLAYVCISIADLIFFREDDDDDE